MSEELIQRNLIAAPETMGAWNYYNIGATTLKALKSEKIIPNKDYEDFEGKRPDALIVKKPQVIAAIEYKQPNQLKTQTQIRTAVSQELGTARALGAHIYIVTDGKKTFWINPLTGNEITAEDGSRIALNFNKDDAECIKLINKAIASISATNDAIQASAVVDPLPLAQKVWQDLWSVSGATPENCLYTFVELFIFKYLSDLGVLVGIHSFQNLLNQYKTNSENDVLEYYASVVRPRIKELFPGNPKDKTTIINGTIFVSKDDKAVSGYATVFKKILQRFDEFGTLENIDYDFKSKLFETFLKESISKKNWGQFFTPLKVVRAIVRMADISAGMKICDPACGVGKFLLEPILHDIHRYFKVENGEMKPQITLSGFDKGFDKDEQKTIILAKANMLIYMSAIIREHSNITRQFAKLFNDTFLLQTNSILGTLAHAIQDEYDLILTNPPYVMSGSSNLKDEIAKDSQLKQYFSINAMGIEGLFMEWIIRALKPGGKAFIIVPDGIMNRSNDKRLRDFILEECFIDAVISLPLNTFFTTNKKTYIMALTKKVPNESGGLKTMERQIRPVFTYLCSEIGETRDVYRFDIEQNDLDAAATGYNMFKGARERYTTIDKRCKIVSIDEFFNGSHWSIERWWTREERIELGIEEEKNTTTLDEFAAMIGDVSNTLLEYQDMISGLQKKNKVLSFRSISITDDEHFDILSAFYLGLNNKGLEQLPAGTIPVYSAARKPIAYIQEQQVPPIAASEDHPILSFANDGDGSAGRNFVLHTQPFYVRAKRYAFSPKHDGISLPYIWYNLLDIKKRFGFSRTFIANRKNLSAVTVDIPIDEYGDFIKSEQDIIAEQFSLLNDMRAELLQKYHELDECKVTIANEVVTFYRTMSLLDDTLFDLVTSGIGYNRTTLLEIDTHDISHIPVYTAGKEPVAYVQEIEKRPPIHASEEYPLLSFATNGDGSAGRNFVRHERPFYINVDRMAIRVKNPNILISYIQYCLYDMKKRYTFNYSYKANRHNLAAVSIDIPIDEQGKFDVETQHEIATLHSMIEQYKREVLEKLNMLITQKVEL